MTARPLMFSGRALVAIPTKATAKLAEVMEFVLLGVPVYMATPLMRSHMVLGPEAKEFDK